MKLALPTKKMMATACDESIIYCGAYKKVKFGRLTGNEGRQRFRAPSLNVDAFIIDVRNA